MKEWWRSVLQWFWQGPAKVHESEEYQRAYAFKQEFMDPPTGKYEWVHSYSMFLYERLQKSHEKLDSKAESLMALLGGGSGLLSVGVLSRVFGVTIPVAIVLGLALSVAFLGIVAAARVRMPGPNYLPPSIAHAIQYVPFFKDRAQDVFLAQWHLACEASRISLARKAKGVRFGTRCALVSVFLVMLSFATSFMFPHEGSKTKNEIHNEKAQIMSAENSENSGSQPSTPNQPAASLPAPDPSTQPQTPESVTPVNPAVSAGPQHVEASQNPATKAGPQTLSESQNTKDD